MGVASLLDGMRGYGRALGNWIAALDTGTLAVAVFVFAGLIGATIYRRARRKSALARAARLQ